LLPVAEYEALLDEVDVAHARRIQADIAAGREELLPSAMVGRLLDGENALRVWREHRGLSAGDLAGQAGISAAYLSELETGKKTGTVETLRKLATVLKLDIDDLVP
jgi:DNA-binding Xre family transcriptional regulator